MHKTTISVNTEKTKKGVDDETSSTKGQLKCNIGSNGIL